MFLPQLEGQYICTKYLCAVLVKNSNNRGCAIQSIFTTSFLFILQMSSKSGSDGNWMPESFSRGAWRGYRRACEEHPKSLDSFKQFPKRSVLDKIGASHTKNLVVAFNVKLTTLFDENYWNRSSASLVCGK